MASRGVKQIGFIVTVALLILSCSPSLHAQLPTGDIIGTVTDASGGALPNAHVTVTNTGTGEMRSADTGASGDYAFTLLQLGTYTVMVEAKGFKKLTAPSVTLASGDRARVDAKMEVGDVTQTVEVAGIAPALQTDTSTIGGSITEQAVQDLPLNGRNFMDLAHLVPGASEGNPQGFGTGTRPDDRRQSSQITVNAQNDSVNNKTIDGMDNNEAVIGSIGVQPSIDAIQEVHVQTNLYTAEVGRTAGAAVDIITKSGTNDFHGSAYEFFRNDVFDARSFFDIPSIGRKPELRQNQFGGSLGGPIKKNKTFFFGDYEGQRVVQGLAVPVDSVPTACEQGLTACGPNGAKQLGNFADICTAGFTGTTCNSPSQTIYNPLTGAALPYNQVPSGSISSLAKNVAALYPAPNAAGFSNNYGSTPLRTQYLRTFDARVDHHIGESDTITGRYTINDVSTATPGNFPATTIAGMNILPGGDQSGSVNAFAGGNSERAQNAAVSYTHIFNPNIVLQLNLAYLRVAIFSTPLNYQTNAAQAFGFPGVNVAGVANGYASGLPLIQLSGYSNIGDDNFVPLKYVDNAFQYNGNLTWTRGNHVFKFGGGLIHRNFEATQSQYPDANYVFNSKETGQQNGSGGFLGVGGNAFASLLLGYVDQTNRNLSLIAPYYGTYEPNAYAQDNWRARPWLTLNLGLRWDLFTPWTERHNYLSNFNPATGYLQQATASDPTALVQTYYHDFAPRIGFAATLGHGMVLRGGFGMTFFPARYASFFQLKNPPLASSFQSTVSNVASLGANTLTSPLGSPTPIPAVPAPGACTAVPFNPALCPSQQINAIEPNWRASYVYQTSLQLQKEFAGNVVGIGYVGEFGHALTALIDINQLNTPGPEPATMPLLGGNPQRSQPYFSTYPKVAVISEAANVAVSGYNGLQVTYERRIRNGLTVSANYTYSHEIDDDIYPGFTFYPSCIPGMQCIVDNGNGTTHTVNGLSYERGNGSYDLPNRWVAAINYQLPFGKNSSGAEKYLIQGWQFNTLASWSSGLPIPIQEAGGSAVRSQIVGTGGNDPGGRPNLVGSLNVVNGTTVNGTTTPLSIQWINPSGMQAQTIGTLGNLGRDTFFSPPLRHVDVSFFKDFAITERTRIQFRYEIFNVTNTPNFILTSGATEITAFSANGTPTGAGGFGTINSTAPNATPRQMQFALKLLF